MASCRKRGSMIFTNSDGSMTSRISSNSFRNMTSFGLWVFGQYLRSAITTCRRDNIQGSWGHGLLPCSRVMACSLAQGSRPASLLRGHGLLPCSVVTACSPALWSRPAPLFRGHGLLPCSGGPSEQPQMRWCFLPYKKEQ